MGSSSLPASSASNGLSASTVLVAFEAMYPDHNLLMEKTREHVRNTVWDLVVCITDQPMQDDEGAIVASLHIDERVAVVSLPALGGLGLSRRLRTTMVTIIAYLAASPGGRHDSSTITALRQELAPPGERFFHTRPDDSHLYITHQGRWSRAQLLAGMVRSNRPWRLLRGLSRALAGALAGITFGVVYSNVWELGASLSAARLTGLALAAVGTMIAWLVLGHRLWERRQHLRNASMVITVAMGVGAFFLAMFGIALTAVALVIPPEYLASTLGHRVGAPDYLAIALMATVLGTITGSVGSGLEDDVAVRQATYGYRERDRHRRVEQQSDGVTASTRPYRRS